LSGGVHCLFLGNEAESREGRLPKIFVFPQCGRAAHLAFEAVPPCQVISLPEARDATRSTIGDEVHWLTPPRRRLSPHTL